MTVLLFLSFFSRFVTLNFVSLKSHLVAHIQKRVTGIVNVIVRNMLLNVSTELDFRLDVYRITKGQ